MIIGNEMTTLKKNTKPKPKKSQTHNLSLYKALIDGYLKELRALSKGRHPVQTISANRLLEINTLLKDVQAIFEGLNGARFLSSIASDDFSTADIILLLKPYQVVLELEIALD